MTLDELKLQVKKDLEVDDETLDKESYKNQELYAKYLDHKTNFELLLYKAKGDYKILYGNTMVVRLMQKSMQPNHLTSKFSKMIYTYT